MAVKMFGVKRPRAVDANGKEEQDFVLADGKEFFAPDPGIVLAFIKAKLSATVSKVPKVLVRFSKDHPVAAAGLKGFVKAPLASPPAAPNPVPLHSSWATGRLITP